MLRIHVANLYGYRWQRSAMIVGARMDVPVLEKL
jgi:hypothetical protein